MTTKGYAKALHALFQESPRATLGKEFVSHLERIGRLALLSGIIKEVEHLEKETTRARMCHVIAASDDELPKARKKAHEFTEADGEGWTYTEAVDPSLIGGYVVRTSQKEFNASDKRGLLELYERLRSVS